MQFLEMDKGGIIKKVADTGHLIHKKQILYYIYKEHAYAGAQA